MGKINYSVPAGMGHIIGNLIRQMALIGDETHRVIGFEVRGSAGALSTIVETSFEIGCQLITLGLTLRDSDKTNEEVVPVHIPFIGELKVDELSKYLDVKRRDSLYNSIKRTELGDEIIIKNTSSETVELVLLFAKGRGSRTTQDNLQILELSNNLYDGTVPLSSHHASVSRFTYKVESIDDIDSLELSWTEMENESEQDDTIIKRTVDLAIKALSDLSV